MNFCRSSVHTGNFFPVYEAVRSRTIIHAECAFKHGSRSNGRRKVAGLSRRDDRSHAQLSRPYGTLTCCNSFPALKRRAIIEKSLRDSAAQNLICALRALAKV